MRSRASLLGQHLLLLDNVFFLDAQQKLVAQPSSCNLQSSNLFVCKMPLALDGTVKNVPKAVASREPYICPGFQPDNFQQEDAQTTVSDALSCINRERLLFDRIATAEGHRVLHFLDETEPAVLLRISPCFEESRHEIIIQNMPGELLLDLCDQLANAMDITFQMIVRKLEESEGCWFCKYMYRMTIRHLSCILEPHFLAPFETRAMLIRGRNESFSRWELSESDHMGCFHSASRYPTEHDL